MWIAGWLWSQCKGNWPHLNLILVIPKWPCGFPHFLHFKSEFCNQELMIGARFNSRSCYCWLYRASPSSAAENIINLISVLTIWWCPCEELSHVVARGCLLQPVHSLGKTLLAFALLHFVLQGQTCKFLQVSLDFLLLHSNPLWSNGIS